MGTVIVVVFVLLWIVLFVFAKPIAAYMADKKILFFSPKKGKIVARKRAGRIIGYYANIEDTGKFIIKETGEIRSIRKWDDDKRKRSNKIDPLYPAIKKIQEDSLLWHWLGVFWLGMDSLFSYWFAPNVKAESIFLKNVFPIDIPPCPTKDMGWLSFKGALLTLRTTHAGLSLNYKDGEWRVVAEEAVRSAVRDYIAKLPMEEMLQEQIEGKSKLLPYLKKLNKDVGGNLGLPRTIGQYVDAFNIPQEQINAEMEKLMLAKTTELKKGEALVIKAGKEKEAAILRAEGEAKATTKTGNSINNVMRTLADIVGKDNAARILVTQTAGAALKETGVTALSVGGTGEIPFILNGANSTKKDKPAGDAPPEKEEGKEK